MNVSHRMHTHVSAGTHNAPCQTPKGRARRIFDDTLCVNEVTDGTHTHSLPVTVSSTDKRIPAERVMPAVDAPLSMSERDLRAAVRDNTRLKHANAALEQQLREERAKYASLQQRYNEVARERDELRARVVEEVPRERGGMGGWINERGGVVDHHYIVKSGAKRVGVMLHEEKGMFPVSQAQVGGLMKDTCTHSCH